MIYLVMGLKSCHYWVGTSVILSRGKNDFLTSHSLLQSAVVLIRARKLLLVVASTSLVVAAE